MSDVPTRVHFCKQKWFRMYDLLAHDDRPRRAKVRKEIAKERGERQSQAAGKTVHVQMNVRYKWCITIEQRNDDKQILKRLFLSLSLLTSSVNRLMISGGMESSEGNTQTDSLS